MDVDAPGRAPMAVAPVEARERFPLCRRQQKQRRQDQNSKRIAHRMGREKIISREIERGDMGMARERDERLLRVEKGEGCCER